jgi:Na+/H+-dicarboxylate symporter
MGTARGHSKISPAAANRPFATISAGRDIGASRRVPSRPLSRLVFVSAPSKPRTTNRGPMKTNDTAPALIALCAALAGGSAIAAWGAPGLKHAVDQIAPIGTLWVNAIRMTVIPLVVSLLLTAIASAADLKSTGRVGVRTVATFVGLSLVMAAVMIPALLIVFSFWPHFAGNPVLPPGVMAVPSTPTTAAPSVGEWLTSLVPGNPISAAANGQMLPLIIFTILLALALTRIDVAARQPLLGFFRGLRDAMLVLVRWIIALTPIGVFGLVLPLAAHAGSSLVGAVGLYVLTYIVACLGGILLLMVLVAAAGASSISRFARAVLPAQVIAISTSSSIASLPVLVEGADERLGLPEISGGFVIPLAVSAFHVAAPVSWTVGALFVARFYGVPLHLGGVFTVAFAAVFLAFAVPGVPRGAFIMLAPLFSAVGLPLGGLGVLIAVDPIPDLFATTLNVTGDLAAAAIVGASAGAAGGSGSSRHGLERSETSTPGTP